MDRAAANGKSEESKLVEGICFFGEKRKSETNGYCISGHWLEIIFV